MIRLDDHYDEHPKIAGLSDGAFRFWHRGLAWACRSLSDGFVPMGVARQLGGTRTKKFTDELIAAKLWEVRDGGFEIHDILAWNWSKAEALAHRAATRDQHVSAGQARARSPRGKGGRFTSGTSAAASGGTSGGTTSGTSGAASELTSELTSGLPAHSQAHSHSQERLAGSSLRSEREDVESRLGRAFDVLGCEDVELRQRLLADDAREVIVEKLELLAAKPGKPGASPSSRITQYLKACEDTLEEERARVREAKQWENMIPGRMYDLHPTADEIRARMRI